MINSTPIRDGNTRSDQPAVHFDTNTIWHFYPPTNPTTNSDRYEPPANDSIIQGPGSAPGGQFVTNTTSITGHNKMWRYNNGTNMAMHMSSQACTTRPPNHNRLHSNSPNSSDNRNGPTCFKCGEQGHMRMDCKERVFCTYCRMANHDTKPCRKHYNSTPSPIAGPDWHLHLLSYELTSLDTSWCPIDRRSCKQGSFPKASRVWMVSPTPSVIA